MNENLGKEEILEDAEYQHQLSILRKEIQKGLNSEFEEINDIPAFFEQIKASAKIMHLKPLNLTYFFN